MEFKLYFLTPLLVLGVIRPDFCSSWFYRMERGLSRVAVNRLNAYFLIAFVSLLLSAAPSLIRLPVPHVHDEFGYLLGADTFAHGRLTNPPHPFWQHFESIHIIQQPTYASKYPPAQSAALAIGELFGHPIFGVWISTAFACITIYWMLLGWMPKRWAFIGGLIAAIHPLILTWGYSYWGGAIAASGGALLFGGFFRLIRSIHIRNALLMGLGMLILANSRPYEGFILSAVILLMVAVWAIGRDSPPLHLLIKRVVIPLTICTLIIALVAGTYNFAVTGNPLKMPYMVHEETYGGAPLFVLQKPKAIPPLLHKALYQQAISYRNYHASQIGNSGFIHGVLDKLYTLAQGFLWSGFLIIPLLALFPAVRYDPKGWVIIIAGSLSFLAMLMATWTFTHYAAPLFGPFIALIIQSLRQLRLWRWRKAPCGLCLSRILLLLCIFTVPYLAYKLTSKSDHLWAFQREQIRLQLQGLPGKHLVIVHYSNTHNPNREWVYNEADIDHSKVAWARAMTPEQDKNLVEYFADRSVWKVQADSSFPRIEPQRF